MQAKFSSGSCKAHPLCEGYDPMKNGHSLLRYSLVVVWLGTALVSVLEWRGQSLQLLERMPSFMAATKPALILGGAAVDAALGLWLLWHPSRAAYLCALGMMLVMTLLATAIDPALWLHPLGPLTKNIPIAAILWMLAHEKP